MWEGQMVSNRKKYYFCHYCHNYYCHNLSFELCHNLISWVFLQLEFLGFVKIGIVEFVKKKSCIHETPNLSTNILFPLALKNGWQHFFFCLKKCFTPSPPCRRHCCRCRRCRRLLRGFWAKKGRRKNPPPPSLPPCPRVGTLSRF